MTQSNISSYRRGIFDYRGAIASALVALLVGGPAGCLQAQSDAPSGESDAAGDPDTSAPPDTGAPLDTLHADTYAATHDSWGDPVECYFGYDTAAPPTEAVNVAVVALMPPLIGRQVIWDVEIRSGFGHTTTQRRVTAIGGGTEKALDVSFVGGCDPTDHSGQHSVTVTTVGVYEDPVDVPDAYGAPAPLGGMGPFVPATTTATFDCGDGDDVRVVTAPMIEAGYAGAGPHGIYDLGVVFAGLACHAEVQCCQDPDGDGSCDAETAWYPPIAGAEWSVIQWRFFCFALGAPQDPPEQLRPTDLFLADVVLDCGDAGAVAIDPTARHGDDAPYCEQPGLSGAPSGCVGLEGAASGLVKQVEVYAIPQSPPYIESTLSMRIGVDKPAMAAHDCTLRARATGARGVTALGLTGLAAPIDGGAYAFGAGVGYPVLTWDATLSRGGAFICGEHSLVTTPQVGVHAATPDERAFSHHLTLEP